jgi:glycogen operon protein
VAEPGKGHPVGARVVAGGVNFTVFSENADSVDLLLFDASADPHPARVVPLARDFHFWHAFVPGVDAGATYAFRATGPFGAPFRFDGDKALLDPYGRSVVTTLWDRGRAAAPGSNVAQALRATVVDPDAYDWEGDTPLARPLDETIVYELNIGGFARPGAFAGLRDKIPHLVDLGVTAIELMPVFQFDPTDGDFWGYNPIAHNEANGEDNRDGSNDNLSWNCGAESETDDPDVEELRLRQIRNFAVVLLLSQGVPMILAGDEVRRTQRGNNNAWNQDN